MFLYFRINIAFEIQELVRIGVIVLQARWFILNLLALIERLVRIRALVSFVVIALVMRFGAETADFLVIVLG